MSNVLYVYRLDRPEISGYTRSGRKTLYHFASTSLSFADGDWWNVGTVSATPSVGTPVGVG